MRNLVNGVIIIGYINFKNKMWKEAKTNFDLANSKRLRDIFLVKIGRCCEKLSLYNEAILYYLKSLEITKDFLWGSFYLGLLYITIGRRDEGTKYLKLANDKNYQNSEIIHKYCSELIKDNDEIDTAIDILTKSLEYFSENCEILILLSKAFENKENYSKAIEVLEQAMLLKEFNSSVSRMLSLGILYEKGQNFNKAMNIYKNILSINKDHIPALCHLASILSHAKEYKRSMKYYKYALSVEENLSFAHFGIGKIYQANNQIEDAMIHYNKCIQNDTKNHK